MSTLGNLSNWTGGNITQQSKAELLDSLNDPRAKVAHWVVSRSRLVIKTALLRVYSIFIAYKPCTSRPCTTYGVAITHTHHTWTCLESGFRTEGCGCPRTILTPAAAPGGSEHGLAPFPSPLLRVLVLPTVGPLSAAILHPAGQGRGRTAGR